MEQVFLLLQQRLENKENKNKSEYINLIADIIAQTEYDQDNPENVLDILSNEIHNILTDCENNKNRDIYDIQRELTIICSLFYCKDDGIYTKATELLKSTFNDTI